MRFVNPQFLWALTLLSIPVLIHLFNFRRYKKLMFTNVHLLQEVLQETKSRRNIRHWVVLTSRLLALSALIFAFAQPFIPAEGQSRAINPEHAVIYLDNSYSMGAMSEFGPLLEQAKERARSMIKAHPQSTRFQLITNESHSGRSLSREEIMERIDRIGLSSRFRTADEILLIASSLNNTQGTAMYIISDLQKRAFDLKEDIEIDSTLNLFLVPLPKAESANLSIDSFWFEQPVLKQGETVSGTLVVSNRSKERLEDLSMNIRINGKITLATAIDLEPGASENIAVNLSLSDTGWMDGIAEIEDAPIHFDDRLYFSFHVRSAGKILCLGSGAGIQYLEKAYSTDAFYSFEQRNELAVDYSTLGEYDLIILHGITEFSSGLTDAISEYVESGGSIALIPSESGKTNINELSQRLGIRTYESPLDRIVAADILEIKNRLFTGVFQKVPKNLNAPQSKRYHKAAGVNLTGEQTIIGHQGGDPLLSVFTHKPGFIYVFYGALDDSWGNLHKHALFVPVVLNIALPASGPMQLYHYTEHSNSIVLNNSGKLQQGDLKLTGREEEWIPEIRRQQGRLHVYFGKDQITAGIYVLSNTNGEPLARIALNYDRRESDLSVMDVASLTALTPFKNAQELDVDTGRLEQSIREIKEGKRLWKWFVAAGLLFLLIEIMLLRLWRPATSQN